jgi:hypothetical protein
MPYIDSIRTSRDFQVQWVDKTLTKGERYRVIEFLISGNSRILIGCVHVATTEQAAYKYIGTRVGGLTLQDGRVVDSKLADLFHKAGTSLAATIKGMK